MRQYHGELQGLEQLKREAVTAERYGDAADLKASIDDVRIQLASAIHHAGSPYSYSSEGRGRKRSESPHRHHIGVSDSLSDVRHINKLPSDHYAPETVVPTRPRQRRSTTADAACVARSRPVSSSAMASVSYPRPQPQPSNKRLHVDSEQSRGARHLTSQSGAQHYRKYDTPAPLPSRTELYDRLLGLRQYQSILEGELVAIRTRRRQTEQRALVHTKISTPSSPLLTRLRDELRMVQKEREDLAEKRRELEQTRVRVRPKDIVTLQRAKALLARSQCGAEEERRQWESELAHIRGRIERLGRQQRERLELSHRCRAALQRERLESRILREELANETQ